jgi:hypothetical protein
MRYLDSAVSAILISIHEDNEAVQHVLSGLFE